MPCGVVSLNNESRKPTADGPKGQLYNLADDLQEQRNLYAQQPEIVARLQKLLAETKEKGRSRP